MVFTTNRRKLLKSALKITVAGCSITSALAPNPASAFLDSLFTPKAEPWEKWREHNPDSTIRIDHSRWASFLEDHVHAYPDGINRVSYNQISDWDISYLYGYIQSLSKISVSQLSRDEQLAFWINLYNALTVRTVLEHYPVVSIRDIDISSSFFSSGPWDGKLIEIGNEPISLNDIEHRIIRPLWKDPRAHYALNCASLGCPNLQPMPFQAETLYAQLDMAAFEFINHPRAIQLKNGRLIASSIYKWFKDDFGGNDKAVLNHLSRYADPALKKIIAAQNKIQDFEYDWKLNGVG